jgi:uncharacterized protein YhaN
MKMTFKECIEMLTGLSEMDKVNPAVLHVRLSYAVAKNKRKLREIETDLQESLKPSEGYKKFLKEKGDLLNKHAERDENGRPVKNIIETSEGLIDNYTIKGGVGAGSPFSKDLETLKSKFKSDITQREQQVERYNDHLGSESDFVPHMVPESLLPEKGIPQAAMNGLIFMITEENTNKKPSKR